MDKENTVVENNEVVQEKTVQQPMDNLPEAKTEPETKKDIDWRRFREQREIERKEKIAAEKRAAEKAAEAEALKAAMDALLNKNSNHQIHNTGFDADESEEQRLQKLVDARLAEREKIYEQERIRKEKEEFPQRLMNTYKDFNNVCSEENLDYLEYHHPEIARAFKYAPDNFDKWADIYHAVKKYVPNSSNNKDQRRAENNFHKPQSMSAPAVTTTGDSAPIQLDEKRRADNWARMQRVMKGGR